MWKNKVNKLKIFMWYYNKSFKNQGFLYTALALLNIFILIKNLPMWYLLIGCFTLYIASTCHMVSPSNSALACTPLKIKDIIKANSLILLIKFSIICLLSLFIKVVFEKPFNFISLMYIPQIFLYIILAYSILNLLFAVECYVPQKYRNPTIYLIIAFFVGLCTALYKLTLAWSSTALVILSLIILMISNILIKKLSYEIIFCKGASQ